MKGLRIGQNNWALCAILVTVMAGWASFSVGQQTQPAGRTDADRDARATRQFDEHVAWCLILENQNEVAAARTADKKADSEEVKNFAQTMITDHEQFIKDLEKQAGNYRNRKAAEGAAAPAADCNVASREIGGTETPAHHDHLAMFMKIHEEMAAQCRASTQKELDGKQGKAFDECYMGLQIAAHMHMADELTVLARHVSPEFKPVLEKGLKTAQQHLGEAKQVMKDINEPGTASAPKVSDTK